MSPHEIDALFEMLHKIMEQNKHLDINLKKLSKYIENHKCAPIKKLHVKKIRS